MEGAEHIVEADLVAGRRLECEQIFRGLLDELAGLNQELFDKFVHGATPQSSAACSTNWSWVRGLTR